jgi:hypothetical protein
MGRRPEDGDQPGRGSYGIQTSRFAGWPARLEFITLIIARSPRLRSELDDRVRYVAVCYNHRVDDFLLKRSL